jgi:hypothetical protein
MPPHRPENYVCVLMKLLLQKYFGLSQEDNIYIVHGQVIYIHIKMYVAGFGVEGHI